MRKKAVLTILIIIVLIGGFLRFYKLGATAFDRDEFFELNSSYGYFKTGQWLSWDFNFERPFPPEMQDSTSTERAEVFRWQLAQLYRFHEPTEFLTRAVGSFWGVAGILLVFFVTRSLTGNLYIALIAAFLTAIGKSEVIYSRRLRMYAMLFPAYLLFSWTVFKFYESKYLGKIRFLRSIFEKTGLNFLYLVPVFIAGFISYNIHLLTVHIAATVAVYTLLMFFIFFAIKKKIPALLDRYTLTSAGALCGLIALNLPLFGQYAKIVRKNAVFFLSKPNYDFFSQYFSDYIFIAIGVFLVFFGTWFLINKLGRSKEAVFLFLSAAVPLALAVFSWKRDVSQRYIYFIQPFGIILSAIGIYGIIQITTAKIKNVHHRWIAIAIILVVSFFCLNTQYIFSKNSELYAPKADSAYPHFAPIFDFIRKQQRPGDVLLTRAYRSFYFRGAGIKVYDIKSLALGKNCEGKIDKIVQENPSGWAIYPKIDDLVLCDAGHDYYIKNLTRVRADEIHPSVEIYRWSKNTGQN